MSEITPQQYAQLAKDQWDETHVYVPYFGILPEVVISRCPYTGQKHLQQLDTYSLYGWSIRYNNGVLVRYTPRDISHSRHLYQVHCFMHLNGTSLNRRNLMDGVFHSSEPEVPFVTPALLRDGHPERAVIHSIPIRKMHGQRFISAHILYVISYYAEDPDLVLARRETEWSNIYADDAYWRVCDYWEQTTDAHWDLPRWVTAGKLLWLDQDEELRPDTDGFPYGGIDGRRHGYRFSVTTGEFKTLHTEHTTLKAASDQESDGIEWGNLYHAYGSAGNIPQLLEALSAPEVETRGQARRDLASALIHQGSHFEASSYVIPHLCTLVKRKHTLDRAHTLHLLLSVGLGKNWGDDQTLPYPADRFEAIEGLVASDYHNIVEKMNDNGDSLTKSEIDMLNTASIIWERDAYVALCDCADRLLPIAWGDSLLSQFALSALPWFPHLHNDSLHTVLGPLSSDYSPATKITAWLTLSLLGVGDKSGQIDTPGLPDTNEPFPVRLASAVALALIHGQDIDDDVVEILRIAERHRVEVDAMSYGIPYHRPLMGFRRLALNRLGL